MMAVVWAMAGFVVFSLRSALGFFERGAVELARLAAAEETDDAAAVLRDHRLLDAVPAEHPFHDLEPMLPAVEMDYRETIERAQRRLRGEDVPLEPVLRPPPLLC